MKEVLKEADTYGANARPSERLIVAALHHALPDTGATRKEIKHEIGMGKSTVDAAVRRLEQRGAVEIQEAGRRNKSDIITLDV